MYGASGDARIKVDWCLIVGDCSRQSGYVYNPVHSKLKKSYDQIGLSHQRQIIFRFNPFASGILMQQAEL